MFARVSLFEIRGSNAVHASNELPETCESDFTSESQCMTPCDACLSLEQRFAFKMKRVWRVNAHTGITYSVPKYGVIRSYSRGALKCE